MTKPEITDAEKAFFSRAAHHVAETGCTIEEAARRVLDDDQRLSDAFGIWLPPSQRRPEAEQLRGAFSTDVYRRLRGNP